MAQTCKSKTAGILPSIIGVGIPALLILVLAVAFLRDEIAPLTSDKSPLSLTPFVVYGMVTAVPLLVLPALVLVIMSNKEFERSY